ncbi:MAG TPA: PEGA domain-containing protein [Kofleriaceae bacterium]
MSSKIECTAVNELIDLVQQKPLDRDSAAELLFQPPREANLRRQVDGTPAPRGLWAVELPIEPTEARATMPKIAARRPQFEPTPRPSGTDQLRAGSDIHAMLKRLAVPAGILVMVGIGIGAAIKLTRHRATGAPLDYVAAFTPPKVIVAPPAPPPAPVQAKLVDVMLASTPPGATATLLDNTTGASTPLGSTPVEASLDPSKQYDVRFELAGHRATTEHLDPATSKKLEVALAEPAPDPAAEPVAAAPAKGHRHHQAKKAAAKRIATASPARHGHDEDGISALAAMSTTKAKAAKDGKPSDAPGFLSITTSVPCAILVDGANTGKTTPAKLSVPAGHHSVRLIAATQHINKQISVDVSAKKTTKLFQSF